MKLWPTIRTSYAMVTSKSLHEWVLWKGRVKLNEKSIAWLKKRGDHPEGVKKLQAEHPALVSECESARLKCRKEDISNRWLIRQLNRRPEVKHGPKTWEPTPMKYDHYLRNRKLVEDV